MSTVLWANYLVDGVVSSDQSDKYALNEHLDQLDEICRDAGLVPLSEWCDSTDLAFNIGDEDELPEGIESTNELMAADGVWIDAGVAVDALEQLLATIRDKDIVFGEEDNAHDEIVQELEESIAYAQEAAAVNGKFNFSVVM
jgi:delta 1-pyrroline-5-carboxylate dehydrogenase